MAGKEWSRQEKDHHHSVPYYTDTVYWDMYYLPRRMNYVDGNEVTGQETEKLEKYIKQMQEIMGGKEKNIEVTTRQSGDKIFGWKLGDIPEGKRTVC